MPLILASNSASGGYEVDNSLRFDVASTDFLIRTIASTGSNQIWTASGWTKRQQLGASSSLYCSSDTSAGNNFRSLFINASDQVQCAFIAGTYTFQVETNALLRDVSAWYHIVAAVDTTQATSTDRVKIWINGVLQTSFATASYPSQNATINFSTSGYKQLIASLRDSSTILNGCYLAEMHILDGVAKQASDFGETDTLSGIWKPKAYTGTYGTNGFYLEFQNSAALGTDSSGNGNTFTVNNLTSIDQTTDTPTNNFATLNPLMYDPANIATMTDGNLTALSTTGSFALCPSTLAVGGSSKWYYEVKCISGTPGDRTEKVGWGNPDKGISMETQGSIVYRNSNGNKFIDNSGSAYGATWTDGDIIGVALDIAGGTVTFYKNGTTQGNITISGGLDDGTFYIALIYLGNTDKTSLNFGNPPYAANGYTDAAGYGNFSYAVPAGYYSLCTKNLADYG